MAWTEVGLLALELLLYAAGMLTLFRLRRRLGLGLFFTALGSLHFLETYLAANLYVQLMPGLSLSPGSVVLFSGKFFFVLLLYIREDALVARQPIYGLLFGNVLTALLVIVLSQHAAVVSSGAAPIDTHLLDQLGALMVWGSLLLFVDCLLVILLYERLARVAWLPLEARLWCASVAVLLFDQAGFFAMLHGAYDVPWSAGLGGLVGKVVAALCYALLIGLYLRRFDRDVDDAEAEPVRIRDLFQMLTYRQRYEALRSEAHSDALTGLPHRGRLDRVGARLLEEARASGRPLSALMIDIDHFKRLNDSFGHQAGDEALQRVATMLRTALSPADERAFRYGGDEFVVLLTDSDAARAADFADSLRRTLAREESPLRGVLDVSIGVATATRVLRNTSLATLLAEADRQLYAAKQAGRGAVRGSTL